jgi:hypothetical protein
MPPKRHPLFCAPCIANDSTLQVFRSNWFSTEILLLKATISVLISSMDKLYHMIQKILYSVLVILMVFSCSNDNDPLVEKSGNSGVTIQTGTICGWCSVNDTLTLQSNSFRYVNYAQCSTSPTTEANGEIESSEMAALLAKLDLKELKKLDLNSCNVCFDGCDDWILYENGSESHYIRFSSDDPKLQSIKAFVDELNAIKVKYSGNK